MTEQASTSTAPTLWPKPVHAVLSSLPEGLADAFVAYEQALHDDDVVRLAAAFRDHADDSPALRSDARGLLVGTSSIEAFRRTRGGIGPRRVIELYARILAPTVVELVSVNAPDAGGRGIITQIWVRGGEGGVDGAGVDDAWKIETAHVAAPVSAIDRSVWRVVGSPLVVGRVESGNGELAGTTIAVKDLFAIAGQRIGAGNPRYLDTAPVETTTATAVQRLVDAGAVVTGIAQTDEFAYSIAGRNTHYGTPPNPAAPGRISGGSSSGPAAAVALGQVDLGLGTDTGGSIRVPASYQGLWGIRTTHGAVDRTGLLPLAPAFDTVGWLTRSPELLRRAARASLTPAVPAPVLGASYVVIDDVLSVVEPDVAEAFTASIERLEATGLAIEHAVVPWLDEVYEAFRVVQATQAWQSDGAWFSEHPDDVAPDVAQRFRIAEAIDVETESEALVERANMIARIDRVLGDGLLLLPSAASAAPRLDASAEVIDRIRTHTLTLTAIAGVTGRPAVSMPVMSVPDPVVPTRALPVGLCVVGQRGTDVALIERAVEISQLLA